MDGTQLLLPAGWALARTVGDPLHRLSALSRDVAVAKANIRGILEGLAVRHGASERDVNAAMNGYVDDLLGDLLYETERDILRDVESGGT
jgi:hypothetical protein